MKWTYSQAGVDLDKHRNMHRYALKAVEVISRKLNKNLNIGSYGTEVKINDLNLVVHTDGVGTKTMVLSDLRKIWVAGWDCVAMNVNDIACVGAKPVLITDYIALPSADEGIFKEIINGLARASEKADVLLAGGETAILPDMVSAVDVVCNVIGIKENSNKFKGIAKTGDVLVGIRSNGPHANGFSLIRKVLKSVFGRYDVIVEGFDLGEWMTRPTLIYSKLVLKAIEQGLINAAAHITGGSFSKLRRIINKNSDINLNLKRYDEGFELIRKLGDIELKEMYRVFNMGIGMVFSTSKNLLDSLLDLIEKEGFEAHVIGHVSNGNGRILVHVEGGESFEL